MNVGDVTGILALAVTILGGVAMWVLRWGKIESAAEVARKAEAEVDKVRAELASFRESVARDYATAAMMAAVQTSVETALNRLSDRLDRVLELAMKQQKD